MSFAAPGTLLLLALLFALCGWLLLLRVRVVPPVFRSNKPGPPFVLRPRQLPGRSALLSEATVSRLSESVATWPGGADRNRLDAGASARATAREGGLPQLVHHRLIRPMGVDLLADASDELLELLPYHRELEAGLRRHRIDVRLLRFDGTLACVVDEEGRRHSPEDLASEEEPRLRVVVGAPERFGDLEAVRQDLRRAPPAAWLHTRHPVRWTPATETTCSGLACLPLTAPGFAALEERLGTPERKGASSPTDPRPQPPRWLPTVVAGDTVPRVPANVAARIERYLGDGLLLACGLATYPGPIHPDHALAALEGLLSWRSDGDPHLEARLRRLEPIELDRVLGLPGVEVVGGRVVFSEALAAHLEHDVLQARWPALHASVLELHLRFLAAEQPAEESRAWHEWAGIRAVLAWKQALAELDAIDGPVPRELSRRMRALASHLLDLSAEGSAVAGWTSRLVRRRWEGPDRPLVLAFPGSSVGLRASWAIRTLIDGEDPGERLLRSGLEAVRALLRRDRAAASRRSRQPLSRRLRSAPRAAWSVLARSAKATTEASGRARNAMLDNADLLALGTFYVVAAVLLTAVIVLLTAKTLVDQGWLFSPPGLTPADEPAEPGDPERPSPTPTPHEDGELAPLPTPTPGADATPSPSPPEPAPEPTPEPEPTPVTVEFPVEHYGIVLRSATVKTSIVTTAGTIECELLAGLAPKTVANFVGLASGRHVWLEPPERFYDGTLIHRVVPGRQLHGGAPRGALSPMAGPGWTIPYEETRVPYHPGAITMAVAGGRDTAGSQWTIHLGSSAPGGSLSYFGYCGPVSVLEEISRVPTDGTRPTEDVVVERVSGRQR